MVNSFYLHVCAMFRIFDFYPMVHSPEFYVHRGINLLKTMWEKGLKKNAFFQKLFTILFFEDQIFKMVKSF